MCGKRAARIIVFNTSCVCDIVNSVATVLYGSIGDMVKPPASAEPALTGTRKTLIQQQSEVTVKDPSTHASRQVGVISACLGH